MKYENKMFWVHVGSKEYRDNFDLIDWGKKDGAKASGMTAENGCSALNCAQERHREDCVLCNEHCKFEHS